MAEHTPTPWICDSEGILPISRDGVSVIARVPNHPENQKNWDADAAFIVKAANNHEGLVAELRRLHAICGHQHTADVLAAAVGGVPK